MSPRRVLAEVTLVVAVALGLGAYVSWRCAREQVFIGTWDLPQTFWQGANLIRVWRTGAPNLTSAFLGLPTPFTYAPALHTISLPLLALTWLTNPWFAYNFMCFVALTANGASMYAVLRLVGMRRDAATIGGGVYLLAPTTLVRSVAHLCLTSTWYLPWMVWLLYREHLDGFRARHWIAFGALIAFMHGSHEYLGLLGLGLLGGALACRLPDLGVRCTVRAGGVALLTYGLLSAPVLWLYLSQRAYDQAYGIHPVRPLEESIYMSASLADYLMPSNANIVYRHFAFFIAENRILESFNYLGLLNLVTLLVLGWWALRRRDRLRAFIDESPLLRTLRRELWATAVGALVLSLGPRWKSAPWIVLPVSLLAFAPFDMVRGWGRYGFVVFFVLALLTAHLAQFMLARTRWPAPLTLAILGVAVLDQLPFTEVPAFRMPLPSALSRIAAEHGRFKVLHLPFHSKSGAQHAGLSQIMQPLHGKDIVGGYAAFDPPVYLYALLQTPLSELDGATQGTTSKASAAALARWMMDADVRFVVYEKKLQFYRERFGPSEDARLRAATDPVLEALVRAGDLERIEDDPDYRVFRVVP